MVSKPDALYNALTEDINQIGFNQNWFDDMYDRRTAPSYQLVSFLKKFVISSETSDQQAIEKFTLMNERCKYFSESFGISQRSITLLNWLRQFFRKLAITYEAGWSDIFEGVDTGPGASVGSDEDDFYTKISSSKMTCTHPALQKVYKAFHNGRPLWKASEEFRSAHFGDPLVIKGSKLSCVPKNAEISRVICTEPLLNMLFQKGFASCIDSCLESYFGIRYRGDGLLQPDKNRELAKLGSIYGNYATIDLSSASDCISLDLVKYILPPSWLGKIMTLRSPNTKLPDGSWVPLHMVSSMGNGFTFPLQTLIFSSILEFTYESLNIPLIRPRGRSLGNYGVFGDDIICVAEASEEMLANLSALGFIPNEKKTFIEGNFRESCGFDYHSGKNIRPFFLKKYETLQDKFVAFNRLVIWSISNDTPIPRTLNHILDDIGPALRVVPLHSGDDEGLKVPWRYARFLGPRMVTDRLTGATTYLYKSYKAKARKIRISYRGDDDKAFFGHSLACDETLCLSLLRGCFRDDTVARRRRVTLYNLTTMTSPCWDVSADRGLTTGCLCRGGAIRLWNSLTEFTLTR